MFKELFEFQELISDPKNTPNAIDQIAPVTITMPGESDTQISSSSSCIIDMLDKLVAEMEAGRYVFTGPYNMLGLEAQLKQAELIKCDGAPLELSEKTKRENDELDGYPVIDWGDGDPPAWEIIWTDDRSTSVKCECGSEVANAGGHSTWCPKFEKIE